MVKTDTDTPVYDALQDDYLKELRAFRQDMVIELIRAKDAVKVIPAPTDHAGVEKAAKALSALSKAGEEIFAAAIAAHAARPVPKARPKTQEEDMNDSSDRLPDHDDIEGWRDRLERQILALDGRKSVAANDKPDGAGRAAGGIDGGHGVLGERGAGPAVRQLA